MQDPFFGEFVALVLVVEHGRHHAAGPAGRCRDDRTAGGVLLADRKCIGEDQSAALQVGFVSGRLDVVGGRLAGQVQRTGQGTFRVEAFFDGRFHRIPDGLEIIPDVRPLALPDILPITAAAFLAPGQDLRDGVEVVDVRAFSGQTACFALRNGTAAYAVHGPFVRRGAGGVPGDEFHPVGMVRQEDFRPPDEIGGSRGGERIQDRNVREVSLAGRGETAVKRNLEGGCFRMPGGEGECRFLRPHRMAAGRSPADFVDFAKRLHGEDFIRSLPRSRLAP